MAAMSLDWLYFSETLVVVKKRLSVTGLSIAALLVVSGCASAGQSSSGENSAMSKTVLIKDKEGTAGVYIPDSVSVSAEEDLLFINKSQAPHNVVWVKHPGSNAPTQSDLLSKDGRYSVRLRTPGVYEYVCTLHPTMRGSVSVSK
jgi:plastocyanin